MKYNVPNPSRFNMVDLPKGVYTGEWKQGPLSELYISEWELETANGVMCLATAKAMRGFGTLEIPFYNTAVVVFKERHAEE